MIIVEFPAFLLWASGYWNSVAFWQDGLWMCNSSRYGSSPPPYTYWVEECPF